MVESRLEALVTRLEAAVARQEALAAAGGAVGGGAAQSGPAACALASSWASTLEPLVADLRAKTGELGNQYVTDCTGRFLQLVIMQG